MDTNEAAAWQSAINSANNSAGIIAQGNLNYKTRQWNEKMYGMQREDALADWQRQNEYNSPAAQMARYKAANLNPNLIYGQQNESGVVRSVSPNSWNPSAPDFNANNGGLSDYLSLEAKGKQVDSYDAAIALQEQNRLYMAARTIETMKDAGLKEWNLDYKTSMEDILKEMDNIKLRNMYEDNSIKAAYSTYLTNKDGREKVENTIKQLQSDADLNVKAAQVARIAQEITKSNVDISTEKIKQRLMEEEVKMKKEGVTWNDDIFFRMIVNIMNDYNKKDSTSGGKQSFPNH